MTNNNEIQPEDEAAVTPALPGPGLRLWAAQKSDGSWWIDPEIAKAYHAAEKKG